MPLTVMDKDADLFESKANVLVNPVNCFGVMGAGLAKQFKEKYPWCFKPYKQHCDTEQMEAGDVLMVQNPDRRNNLQWIACVATKEHWSDDSSLKIVNKCVDNMRKTINRYGVKHIAVPALGCGLGGLQTVDWYAFHSFMSITFEKAKAQVDLYVPH